MNTLPNPEKTLEPYIRPGYEFNEVSSEDALDVLKEFARQVVVYTLEQAAKKGKGQMTNNGMEGNSGWVPIVNQASILSLETSISKELNIDP